ncbi:MAG: spermidine synthase [Wenzhouxiangella sp.]
MSRSVLLAEARIPDTGKTLRLYEHKDKFSMVIPGRGELMNSRVHGSEKALAELACARMGQPATPRILVGGLGMGFTQAAALAAVGPDAEVVVAELVPEVVDWHRDFIGEPAGHPLADPRSTVFIGDVAALLRAQADGFNAILLDVDNGPQALIRRENDWLYGLEGLAAAHKALRKNGVLAVWSAGPDIQFSARLKRTGFRTEQHIVRPHRAGKGARHTIWLAQPR